ncbi:ParB/RepB/Spo0J family partition protein [Streptomyces sp. PU_AKi4]|uniref:ParB/RepB/Spo0J family partition protein n=1 Tax=Streptomyces sp. PU_AKi4 TaxID=2800809 RepID=UPI0035244B7D
MGKRDDFSDFWGDDDATPVVDTRADGRLYRVPLGRLTANLVNPRTDFGTEDQLIDLGKSLARRQNQPCPVVSRGAYLKLWPDHDDRIGDVDYVLVSGERRFRAATAVGLPALDCVANDDVAADRKTFMEAVVSENVDRRNFDPIEEAYAVQSLVAEFGSNRAVAQHFDRVDGWVTQRVLLTHLAHEVQDLVRTKAMPLEVARTLGKLARDNDWSSRDQLEWWEAEQEKRAAAVAARSAARKAARQQTPAAPVSTEPSFTAVKPDPTPEPARSRGTTAEPIPEPTPEPAPAATVREVPFTAVNQPPALQAPAPPVAVPTQAAVPTPPPVESVEERQPKRFPYDNGADAARHLIHKMPPDEFKRMLDLCTEHWETQATNVP